MGGIFSIYQHCYNTKEMNQVSESTEVMQSKCDAFNKNHPIGSPVTVVKDFGEQVETKVKHPAQILSGHTPVVWLAGISGCYLLDRVL